MNSDRPNPFTTDAPDEFLALVDAFLCDDCTDAEIAELNAKLDADPAARQQFVAYCTLCRFQHEAVRGVSASPAPTVPDEGTAGMGQPSRAGRMRIAPMIGSIAAAFLLAAAVVAIYFTPTETPKAPQPDTFVATLIDATGTLIYDDDVAHQGVEYAAGTYALEGGDAELLLANQVTVLLSDHAQLTMHDPMHATLVSGAVGFECPPGAKGFSVRLSPRVRIVDLGTAFRIVKPETGAPFIWVTEGRVRVDINGPDDAVEAIELTAGEYGWVERVGSDAPRFVRRIEPTPGTIAGVSVFATSNLHGAFDRDARQLVDGAGLDPATGRHSAIPDGTTWLTVGVGFPTSVGDDRRPAVTFDLGGLCLIESLRVWNYNESVNGLFRRGVKAARLLVSDDGERFRPLTDPADGDELFTFDPAPGRDDIDFSQVIAIEPAVPVTHVRLEVVTTHEGSDFDAGVLVADGFAGLSEVRFIGTPIGPRHEKPTQEADRQRSGD